MNKNVLVNIGLFAPRGEMGGVSVYVYNVCKILSSNGYIFHLIIKNKDNCLFPIEQLREEGFIIYRVSSGEGILGHISYFIKSTLLSIKIIDSENIDIIHSNHIYEGVSGLITSQITHIPLICTYHGGWYESITWTFKKFIRFFVSIKAKKIILLNNQQIEEFKNRFHNKITLIPTGVNIDEFNISFDKELIRSKYGLNPEEKLILTISVLNKRKNVDLLIESYAHIQKKLNSRLIIVGDGPEIMKLKKYGNKVSKNIIFTGRLPRDEIIKLQLTADLFVLTSKMEGLPLVLLEAMAAKTPVISTGVGGIPELIKNDYNGYIVPFDSEKIAQTILDFFSDNQKVINIPENAYNTILKNYEWKKIAEQVQTVYNSI